MLFVAGIITFDYCTPNECIFIASYYVEFYVYLRL